MSRYENDPECKNGILLHVTGSAMTTTRLYEIILLLYINDEKKKFSNHILVTQKNKITLTRKNNPKNKLKTTHGLVFLKVISALKLIVK